MKRIDDTELFELNEAEANVVAGGGQVCVEVTSTSMDSMYICIDIPDNYSYLANSNGSGGHDWQTKTPPDAVCYDCHAPPTYSF